MSGESIKWRIRKQGLPSTCFYFLCRAAFKLQLCIIGKAAQHFGSLKKNRIVFKNRQFLDYSDNARALSDYLLAHDPGHRYEIIWMVSDKKALRTRETPNVKFVTAENKFGWSSPAACWFGATAGFFFYTHHSGELNRYHCSGQTTVNLWHGCSYKANVEAAKAERNAIQSAFDYALVPGPFFIRSKSAYWNCSAEKILPIGYPRYDWMLHSRRSREELYTFLNAASGNVQALVLWLPTFRKSAQWNYAENAIAVSGPLPGLADLDELRALDRFCKDNKLLLVIKPHPLDQLQKMPDDLSNIRYISEHDLTEADIRLQDLLAGSDALLSDYSSAAVDYLLLDRPVGYIIADFEQYKTSRGFVMDDPLPYMPGEKIRDLSEIELFLSHVVDGQDLFRDQRRQLMPELHNRTDCYCERILNYLKIDLETGRM